MVSIDRDSPLLRAVVLGAGLVIIAAGMKATASVANLILLSMLLATTLYPDADLPVPVRAEPRHRHCRHGHPRAPRRDGA